MAEISARAAIRAIRNFNRERISTYQKTTRRKHVDKSEYAAVMKDSGNILEVENMFTYFYTDIGTAQAVNGISFEIPKGKTVALVGESGCGKSVTSLSIMRLLAAPVGQIAGGEIRFSGNDACIDIAKTPQEVMRRIRGKEIAMIFQEPMTSLNPVFTIGSQIDEILLLHFKDMTKKQARERSIEMLKLVGIARADEIYKSYPHQLSGGMRQRAMIAMSIACDPRLIIADEPTTALDVSIQAQILELMRGLKTKISGSILLITHDLGVVAEMADIVVVMYSGRIVEAGTADEIFYNALHPYTRGLLLSKPKVGSRVDKLYSIPGQVGSAINLPNICYFKKRCESACMGCDGAYPDFVQVSPTHRVACHLIEKGE